MSSTEERLVELEIKAARQDDLLDVLNQTVYRQQKRIDELEALCAALARHVKDMRDAAQAGPVNERPPHY
ncbi:MAG TPA: SlyX family protein [Noviherbaspirillum sp.]